MIDVQSRPLKSARLRGRRPHQVRLYVLERLAYVALRKQREKKTTAAVTEQGRVSGMLGGGMQGERRGGGGITISQSRAGRVNLCIVVVVVVVVAAATAVGVCVRLSLSRTGNRATSLAHVQHSKLPKFTATLHQNTGRAPKRDDGVYPVLESTPAAELQYSRSGDRSCISRQTP